MKTIELDSDLGEGYGPWRAGDDGAMLHIVTSANVACGGHVDDPETMFETLRLAKASNVVLGASRLCRPRRIRTPDYSFHSWGN